MCVVLNPNRLLRWAQRAHSQGGGPGANDTPSASCARTWPDYGFLPERRVLILGCHFYMQSWKTFVVFDRCNKNRCSIVAPSSRVWGQMERLSRARPTPLNTSSPEVCPRAPSLPNGAEAMLAPRRLMLPQPATTPSPPRGSHLA